MKRREILKTAGFVGLAGITGMIFSACGNNQDKSAGVIPPPDLGKSPKDKLITNRTKMNYQDPDNPNEHELKHTPDIKLGDIDGEGYTEVHIIVGSNNIIHPTTDNHWIDYIKLFADDKLVGEVLYEPGLSKGFTCFKVRLTEVKILKAEIGCNIHGIWENQLIVNEK